jgi:hypothetical protein
MEERAHPCEREDGSSLAARPESTGAADYYHKPRVDPAGACSAANFSKYGD